MIFADSVPGRVGTSDFAGADPVDRDSASANAVASGVTLREHIGG